ncbi:hypothetical protein JMJ55_04610 [Belnapia sp. T6]|uniref:ABM domain-containing protein n=1 Tax=Belnapia mucosa TaxID=2804532 RepID=A0ABS1UYX8_9PROT|nr:hypothetical protein [Belnapia mucosa]MBL6454595.1 hypothetical protein [Belnapia mucosa]
MYVAVRKYAEKAALMGGLVPRVSDGFVPVLRRAAGFKGYCAFPSEDGHAVSVTIFADRPSAMLAEDRHREWVVSNLRDLLPNPPEVTGGETLLHEVSKIQRNGGSGMFVTVRVYEGVGPREEVLPLVREHVFLTITGAPGFRGYYAFFDEQDASRAGAVSLFDTRQNAMQANERVVSIMRERRIAPNPPTVMLGQTAIVAAA